MEKNKCNWMMGGLVLKMKKSQIKMPQEAKSWMMPITTSYIRKNFLRTAFYFAQLSQQISNISKARGEATKTKEKWDRASSATI